MRSHLRFILGAATLVLAGACGTQSDAPTVSPADLFELAAIDPTVGAEPAQASMPGFTMSPDPTYSAQLGDASGCAYSASAGRVLCAPVTRNGLTITRSMAFYDAAGLPQSHRDSLTRSTNTQVTVKGTTTTDRGSLSVDRGSSLTVSGLGKGATTHTLNGTENGTTSGTLKTDKGQVTTSEKFASATKDVVVPAEPKAGTPRWPLSGTITRSAAHSFSLAGGPTRTVSHTEQVTFNGTSTVKVTITHDGVTKNCTRDLGTGRTTCG